MLRNKSIKDIISDNLPNNFNNSKSPDEKYGVCLDEYSVLVDDEDYWDCAKDAGCDPAIVEYCEEPVVYTTVDLLDGDEIEICQAAYNQIRPGYTIIINGPRRSGKSKLIKNICQRVRPWFPEVVVFTTTKDSGEYFGFIPISRVVDGLDEDLLLDLIASQKRKKKAQTRGEDVGNFNMLIILDDCMSQKLRYKDIFNLVFFQGRHYNITLLVTIQDVKGVAPAATVNADLCYSFPVKDERSRETINSKYCDFLDKNSFRTMMANPDLNKKYHVLCYDMAHVHNPINRRITFGCVNPKEEKKFVMGDKEMWEDDKEQLVALGFGYLLSIADWGIIKTVSKKKK